METLVCPHPNCNEMITMKLCTWHDSCASWHVQNFVTICYPTVELHSSHFSIDYLWLWLFIPILQDFFTNTLEQSYDRANTGEAAVKTMVNISHKSLGADDIFIQVVQLLENLGYRWVHTLSAFFFIYTSALSVGEINLSFKPVHSDWTFTECTGEFSQNKKICWIDIN